jgi:hypothetical protein
VVRYLSARSGLGSRQSMLSAATAAAEGSVAPAASRPSGSTIAAVMSRAPQKYLVQNQSGLRLYYWADAKV